MAGKELNKTEPGKELRYPFVKSILILAIFTFLVTTIVAIGTARMGNNQAWNSVFGSFESTGAAIILIGFPYLCLQLLKYHQGYIY